MSGKYLTEEEVEKAREIIKHAMRHQMSSYIRQTLSESLSILTAKESETAGTDDVGAVRKIREHTIFHSDDDSTEFAFHLTTEQAVAEISLSRAEAAQEAREERDLLLQVLAFYADERNWETSSTGFAAQYDPEPSPVDKDRGGKARAAIAGKEEVKP